MLPYLKLVNREFSTARTKLIVAAKDKIVVSQRVLALRFGVSKATVLRMFWKKGAKRHLGPIGKDSQMLSGTKPNSFCR